MVMVFEHSEEVRRNAVNRVMVDRVPAKQVAAEIGIKRWQRIYYWARSFGFRVNEPRKRTRNINKNIQSEKQRDNMGDSRLWSLSGEMCSALGTDRGAELVREYLELRSQVG